MLSNILCCFMLFQDLASKDRPGPSGGGGSVDQAFAA